MIYLDCAATSLQKPRAVPRAVMQAMRTLSSPGRGAYPAAMRAADTVFYCREAIAALFGMKDPGAVVFTMNATHGLNIAIRSLAKAGSRAVISGYEHNAVTRPLRQLGAEVTVAASPLFQTRAAVEAFRRALPGADVAVCNHVSNAFGYVLPIAEIAVLCRKFGVPLIVDASQSAGCIDLNFDALGAAFMAMPGHKGLLGPQGTGVLLCGQTGEPLIAGGTGSRSAEAEMPDFLPDCHEAGTHNTAGIAGLLEGVCFVAARGPGNLGLHERRLMHLTAQRLNGIGGLELFVSKQPDCQTGVLSVRHGDVECETLAAALGKAGVAVRAGLHCAPVAHRSAGTFSTGTLRMSFSPFNTPAEATAAAEIMKKILTNYK